MKLLAAVISTWPQLDLSMVDTFRQADLRPLLCKEQGVKQQLVSQDTEKKNSVGRAWLVPVQI